MAFLWRLFVEPPWFGSGLALLLHDEALREARTRGYSSIRLFAAAGQARARRFYEREGWVAAGPPFMQKSFGMDVVDYRRSLTTPPAS
jgi:GNAT superfamily N-acetyltransferase